MKSRLHAHIGSFRQLELLLAVYETGSISAAAEKLHLAQPTVSMQLKKLSKAIDMPLYNQIGKKLVFTEAGLRVVASARNVLENIDRLDMDIADLKGLKSGSLSLAVVTSSKYFAPHLLGTFSSRFPGIDVQMKVGNREEIIQRFSQEQDDFYIFSHLPEDIHSNHTRFLSNPLIAIAHKKHPLAKKKQVNLDTFFKESFIIREKGSGTRFAIDQFCEKHKKSINIRMTIESNEAIKHAVMSGLGVSILSAHSLSFIAGASELSRLNVQHLPIDSSWYITWSKQKNLSPIAREFAEFLRTEGKASINTLVSKNRFL